MFFFVWQKKKSGFIVFFFLLDLFVYLGLEHRPAALILILSTLARTRFVDCDLPAIKLLCAKMISDWIV